MTLEQVEYLITQFQKLAAAAQKKGETRKWGKLGTHVTELERWRDSGMKGTCPVDYKSLGIKLPKGGAARKPGHSKAPKGKAKSTKLKTPKTSGTRQAAEPLHVLDSSSASKSADTLPDSSSLLVSVETLAKPETIQAEDEMQDLTLKENLSRAEELLGKDEFAAAISLAETILKNQKTPDDVRQRTQQVANEARIKREAQIKALLDLAKKAFDDKAWDAAEKNYRQALELDEEDQRALEGLNALMSSKSEAEQKVHLEEIKAHLQDINKIDVLANAVREAEQLIARKKADDELVQLYQAGKDRWDELREKQGQTTTKARVGNLESRAEAVHEYEQYIIHNQMTVWDATLNTFIPTDEALKEARRNWEDFSHQETQKRLNEVDRNLPHNLDWARQRLVDAVNQQYYDFEDTAKKNPLGFSFFEHDRADLQARLAEIERLIKNRDQAEALRERARTTSPEDGLNLLLDARRLWEHLEGIDKRIAEQRELVGGILADRVETKLRDAQSALNGKQVEKAKKIASEASRLCKQMSEPRPQLLKDEEKKVNTFFDLCEIHLLLEKPDTRKQAFKLFDEVIKRSQLERYQLDSLKISVEAYRNVAESWKTIEFLYNSDTPNWAEIIRACDNFENAVKGSEYAQKAAQIRREAEIKLKITRGQQFLNDGDLGSAETIFKGIIRSDKQYEDELRQYLVKIENYRKNDKKTEGKFARALSLKTSDDLHQKLQSIQMFLEVAQDVDRSSFTIEARKEASDLGDQLRKVLLPRLIEMSRRITNEEQTKQGFPSEVELETATGWAGILREANLAWEEDEKRYVRIIEMAYYQSIAAKQGEVGQWGMVVRTWETLEKFYPNFWEIELEARKARKQKAILDAKTALTQENAQKALDVLREEQTRDDWGGDVDLNYQLAEAYRRLGKFEDAERCALTVRSDKEPDNVKRGDALLVLIREDRIVSKAYKEISELKAKGDYESALEVIKRLPQDLRDRTDVARIRDEIIVHAQAELLKAVKKEQAKGTIPSMVDAVEMLVRLRGIEKLSLNIEEKAEAELKQLRDQLPLSANQVIRTAGAFNPSKMDLEDALREARRLSNQLQAFLGIAEDFPPDSWSEMKDKIQARLISISDRIERLEKIQGLLDKVKMDGGAWKQAVKTNNFATLQEISGSLQDAAGPDLQVADVRKFTLNWTETMEIRRYIAERFKLIKEGESLFLAKEDFGEVVKICKGIRNLPARTVIREARGNSWQVANQNGYQTILTLADSELDFYDTITEKHLSELATESNKNLLDMLSSLAAERKVDLQKWEDWFDVCQRLHESARTSYESARRMSGGAAEVVKEWKKVLNHTKKAETHFVVDPAPLSSRFAYDTKDEAMRLWEDIQTWRDTTSAEIEKYSECASQNPPTTDDLKRLSESRNYVLLAENLVRAKFNYADGTTDYKFAVYLEDTVLRNIRDIPPLEKLQNLHETAERCLGINDTLTRQIEEKIADKSKQQGKSWNPFRK
jgi:hypothetical protein